MVKIELGLIHGYLSKSKITSKKTPFENVYSRNPNDLRIVRPAFVRLEIPISRITKPHDMAVQKEKLGAALMQVRMDVILLSNGRSLPVIK